MLVENFKSTCGQYENFQIWDLETLNDFFKGNQVIPEIFENEFKVKLNDFKAERQLLAYSDIEIIERILNLVADKHFFTFTFHSKNHTELIFMQEQKIMNFGIDIKTINPAHAFIIIMDKKKVHAA